MNPSAARPTHVLKSILGLLLTAIIAWPPVAEAQGTRSPPREKPERARQQDSRLVIENTLEAALGQPRVRVELSTKDGPLSAKPAGDPALRELLGDDRTVERSFPAFLDTGASGHVISKSTADRFGIARHE